MSPIRGMVLVAAGAFAIWRGVAMHTHRSPWPLLGLGLLAVALGAWHLTRRPARRRP
jgi:uncharacterized membrane protein HdeD (DUF308 family)